MNELNNVRMVHESAMSPDPIYARKPLDWYVGRSVKIGFQSHQDEVEYMWVKVTRADSPNLIGQLDNIPMFCTHLTLADRITLSRLHIVEVDLTEEEWWEEVSILRAQGDFFNRHLGTPCPESGFGQFYDAHFTPRQALQRWAQWQPDENETLHFPLDIAADRDDLN